MGYPDLILISSIVLLSYSAFVATKLISIALWKKPWSAFAFAVNILLIFQLIQLYRNFFDEGYSLDPLSQFILLIISSLITYTVWQTRPGFKVQRRQNEAEKNEKINAENKLAILNKFSTDLIKLDTPDDLVWHVASEVVGQMGLDDCVIYLLDEKTKSLIQAAAIGAKTKGNNEIVAPIVISEGCGITGWSAINQKSIIVDNVLDDPRYIAELDYAGSEICVPIVNEGRVFGVIDSESPMVGFYTEQHLDILQTIASMLAFRLAQWENIEQINNTSQKLIEAQSIAHCGNWSLDIDTKEIIWSDEVFRIFGYEPQSFEPTYSLFLSLVPEDEREKIDKAVNRHIKNKSEGNYSIDHSIKHTSGQIKYVNQHGITIFDENRTPITITGTILDITERKTAEMEARETRNQLVELFKLAPEAIITFDSNLNIEMFNRGAERTFDYKVDEVLGEHLNILIPKEYHTEHKAHLDKFIFSDQEYRSMDKRTEIEGVKKDGTVFPAMASVSKQKTKSGIKYTVLLRDITQKKQSDEKLKKALIAAENANRAKTAFLAAMSHELRTPLNAIMGFSQVIDVVGFEGLGQKKVEDYADLINQSSRSLLQLFNNVLDISKLEAGEYTLNKQPTLIRPYLQSSIEQTNKLAEYKNITLQNNLTDEDLSLNCDQTALQKILSNSIANAIQFTPSHSQINISASNKEEHIEFVIICDEANISSKDLIAISNPMDIELDNPYHAIDGTRLNLLIVKLLTELHDGSLEIKSLDQKAIIKIGLPQA